MPVWIIIIFVVLALFFVLFVWSYFRWRKRKTFSPKELQYIRSHWLRIIDSCNAYPNHAILDADKLLDYALGKQGFEGNVAEKLKKGGSCFSDLNGLWSAHKLRNHVAHELGKIDERKADRALRQFKRALNDLGAKL